jgi:hypothetical protein
MASAGLQVSRGRLPGITLEGWRGSVQELSPRGEITQPSPGKIGVLAEPSLGVAENALPMLSTTQR